MHAHAGYHDTHIAILRANQKYNLKSYLVEFFKSLHISLWKPPNGLMLQERM